MTNTLLEQVVRVVVGILLSFFQTGGIEEETIIPAGETVVGETK